LFDTPLESDSVFVVTNGWRFLFCSLYFRSSFFPHCLSLAGFHSFFIILIILHFIFSLATDSSKNVIYLYLKFWIGTELQTHFLRRYRSKTNTALVTLEPLSFTWIAAPLSGRTRNSRERKLCLPHSYYKNNSMLWPDPAPPPFLSSGPIILCVKNPVHYFRWERRSSSDILNKVRGHD
jgi:hypothetical protein